MFIHFYYSLTPNSGDIRRITNINREFSEYYSSNAVEVVFYGLSDRKIIKKNGKFRLNVSNKKFYIPVPPKVKYYLPIYQSLVLSFLGLIIRPKFIIGEMSFPPKFCRIFRLINPNVRLFIDIHGARVEEFKYNNPNVTENKIKNEELIERTSIIDADYVICQSDEMKSYIINKYQKAFDDIIVYRCGYDSSKFYVNPYSRKEYRKKMSVRDDEILFVYSGGLHKWQKIVESIDLFLAYHQYNPRSKFLILSGDRNLFEEIVRVKQLYQFKDIIFSFSVDFDSVVNYLNASDVAFLIRDNHMMNAVASPTKLAEYLACGLPIITSSVVKYWVTNDILPCIIYEDDVDIFSKIDRSVLINKQNYEKLAYKYLSLSYDRANFRKFISRLK